jgi:hypothetical protein
VCGDELLTEEQRQAVLDAIEARVAEVLGDVDRWQPLGLVPEAFKASFTATYTPACRICAISGHLACPAHGPFRPLPELPPFRAIGSC